MAVKPGLGRRLFQSIGSLRTGIILLIIVGVMCAAGTVILQRPLTSAEDMERAYSPETLRILDTLGLTDVYHSWYFISLMGLLAISIILVSIDRWPNAWRYYARPYRRTDQAFRAVLPLQKSVPITDAAAALDTAEQVLKKRGLSPQRIVEQNEVSLYAEKNRFAVLAVYVVHASLLLILAGGIIDGMFGYKGYINLVADKAPLNQIELQDGTKHPLGFSLRCDEAGQENYTGQFANMPKRWWSKLVVTENGQEVLRKEISVNDPLVYRGMRFYQSGYGSSGEIERARIAVVRPGQNTAEQVISLALNGSAALPDGSTLKMTRWISDAYAMDGGLYQRSRNFGNAAMQLQLTSADGTTRELWMYRTDEGGPREKTMVGPYDVQGNPVSEVPYRFVASLELLPFTGLAVSHEPGQSLVWAGCVLMGLGMILAFYVLHQRFWVTPVVTKDNKLALWMGAAANKKRESFDLRFREMASDIEQALSKTESPACAMAQATSNARA
ncbi:MAG: cytochrome c biogenesis protein ResB [Terriglobales bacterium]